MCTATSYFNSMERKAEAGDETAQKYVKLYKNRPEFELYDLKKDPLELNNIAANPENSSIMKELKVELDKWMAEQGDKGVETEMKAKTRQIRGRKKKK